MWIKKIVGEEIETKEDSLGYKLAKEAVEAAKAAAASAAAVAEASEELIIIKIEGAKNSFLFQRIIHLVFGFSN